MSDRIKLVQGDKNVIVKAELTDRTTGSPVDVSGADVFLYYKRVGATALTATVSCTKPNGGVDGLVYAMLPEECMAEAGDYDGEYEVVIGAKKQTVYEKQKFRVRKQLEV